MPRYVNHGSLVGHFFGYLTVPRPSLRHSRFRPEGHRESRNEIGSLSPAECLVRFEPVTFRF